MVSRRDTDSKVVTDNRGAFNNQEGMDSKGMDLLWGSRGVTEHLKGGTERLKVDMEALRALMGLHRALTGSKDTSRGTHRDPLSSRGMGISREWLMACMALMAGCTPRETKRL